ncbi:hypothetical protein BGZ63DRAFT_386765 [Mariannaea sp. PMI_226]|nr:hypothetical protein BGZ63DRAFT_386765 [Mariannaea sp. PMI_226]
MFVSRAIVALAIAGASATTQTRLTIGLPNWFPWENATALEGTVLNRQQSATTVILYDKAKKVAYPSDNPEAYTTVTWGSATAGYSYEVSHSVPTWDLTFITGNCKLNGPSPFSCTDARTRYTNGMGDPGTKTTITTSYSTTLAVEVDITAGAWKLTAQNPLPTDEGHYGVTHYTTSLRTRTDDSGLTGGVVAGVVVGIAGGIALLVFLACFCSFRGDRDRKAAMAAVSTGNDASHLPTYETSRGNAVAQDADAPPPTCEVALNETGGRINNNNNEI